MESWQTWLPATVTGPGRVESVLAEVATAWSGKWFADVPAECAERSLATVADWDFRWRVSDRGIAFGTGNEGEAGLAALMLDACGELGQPTARDTRVIEQLASACLEDLGGRLARIFDLGGDLRWRIQSGAGATLARPRLFEISAEVVSSLVFILVEPGLIATLVKATLGRTPPLTSLQPIDAALERQPVRIAGLLGQCELTLADLSGLVEGDVLVLDRRLDEPLDLTVNGVVKPGRCSVEQTGDGLALKILEPLTE